MEEVDVNLHPETELSRQQMAQSFQALWWWISQSIPISPQPVKWPEAVYGHHEPLLSGTGVRKLVVVGSSGEDCRARKGLGFWRQEGFTSWKH